VTADAKGKVYGDADPQLTYRLTGGSLVGSDQLTGSLTRQPGDNVGSYAIQQGTLTAGSNYDLIYVGANLEISPRQLTVTADAKSKVYGEADPRWTYQVTGGSLVGGDQLTGGLARQTGDNIGSYAIGQGTLTAGNNYQISYVAANLGINRPAFTITPAPSESNSSASSALDQTATAAEKAVAADTPALPPTHRPNLLVRIQDFSPGDQQALIKPLIWRGAGGAVQGRRAVPRAAALAAPPPALPAVAFDAVLTEISAAPERLVLAVYQEAMPVVQTSETGDIPAPPRLAARDLGEIPRELEKPDPPDPETATGEALASCCRHPYVLATVFAALLGGSGALWQYGKQRQRAARPVFQVPRDKTNADDSESLEPPVSNK
jgi:hypothetical protein